MAIALLAAGCARPAPPGPPVAIRLLDLYKAESVVSRVSPQPAPRIEWRFDGAGPSPAPQSHAATRGWEAGPGVGNLRIRDGRLVGRATTAFPILHFEWPGAVGNLDTIHAVEVRLRVSAGKTLGVDGRSGETVDLAEVLDYSLGIPWDTTAPLTPGGEVRTVTLSPPRPRSASYLQHLLIRPTDVAGAEFAIESVRVVLRHEHLDSIASGVGWQGLSQIYRESLVARAPEALRFAIVVPPRALLDLAVGTVEDAPVGFTVRVRPRSGTGGGTSTASTLLARTVTTPHRWEPLTVDLTGYAGESVDLELALSAGSQGALGFWGAPVVRQRVPDEGAATAGDASQPATTAPPQGIILIWTDTLRRDHLGTYGYSRPTSPNIDRLAREGARFDHCVTQATWTKVATPSLLASLYPTTHGVTDFSHRLPAATTTLAEVLRSGGFATISLSSILFTGQFTNLHQGFEELHEDMSLPDRNSSKTARVYVDRLIPWLERHRQVPFFAFLHVSDAHDPYEPYPPYSTQWSDPAGKTDHQQQAKKARERIADPLLKAFGMPTRAEMESAGVDADAYVSYDQGWYDGSILAMDAEIGRLVERLRELGLDRRTLVVLAGDHGEEFLDHGRTFHGQSTYGELANVPLVVWRPGAVPAGEVIGETVETIDVMPTILDLVGLPLPKEAQGTSLRALLGSGGGTPWRSRPAFTEKNVTFEPAGAPPPMDTEIFTIVDGRWKLVHNTVRPRGGAELELYDTDSDRFELHDVAAQHPEIVARLAPQLAAWHAKAAAARRPAESSSRDLSAEEIQRLKSLGYLQ